MLKKYHSALNAYDDIFPGMIFPSSDLNVLSKDVKLLVNN